MTDTTSDTCPACGAVVIVPHTGEWIRCEQCGKGRLRWKPDGQESLRRALLAAERQRLERLREELRELDGWVREGLPGAAERADRIHRRLLGMMGEE